MRHRSDRYSGPWVVYNNRGETIQSEHCESRAMGVCRNLDDHSKRCNSDLRYHYKYDKEYE